MAKKAISTEKKGRGEPPIVKKRTLKAETPPTKKGNFSGNTPENGTSQRTPKGKRKKRLLKVPTTGGKAGGKAAEKGVPKAAGKEPKPLATPTPPPIPTVGEKMSDDPLDRAKKGMEELERGKPRARGKGSAKAEEVKAKKETPQDRVAKQKDPMGREAERQKGQTGVEQETPHGDGVRRSLLERFLEATTSSATRSSGTAGSGPDIAPQDVGLQDIGVVGAAPIGSPVPDLHEIASDPAACGTISCGTPSCGQSLSSNNLTEERDISGIRDGSQDPHSQDPPEDPSMGALTVGGSQVGVGGSPGPPQKVNITDIIGTCGPDGLPILQEPGVFGGGVKRTCDRCPLKGKCPDYGVGQDCVHQALLDRHTIGNHLDALAAMAGLATRDLARIEEALLREAITGIPEERTDILVGEVHKRLKDLVKLLDPESGDVKRKLTLSNGTGQVAVLIEKAKRGLLPSLSVLPPMSPKEASQRLHEESYRSHLGLGSEMASGGLGSDGPPEEHSSLDNEDLTDGNEQEEDGLTDLKTAERVEEEPHDGPDFQSFWE